MRDYRRSTVSFSSGFWRNGPSGEMLGHPAALGGGGIKAGFMRQSCQYVRTGWVGSAVGRISCTEGVSDVVRTQRRHTAARVAELSRDSTFQPRRPAEHTTGRLMSY